MEQRQQKFRRDISYLCKSFRKDVLRLTLRELSDKTGEPIPTLSSFELGRSSNLRFLYIYLVSCETDDQKELFITGFHKLLERTYYNG